MTRVVTRVSVAVLALLGVIICGCLNQQMHSLDETNRIQLAIDAAAAAGGGRVVVPKGRHLVGQLDLRTNVELHLEEGAVLEGKVGLEHYRVTELPYSEGT